MVGTRSASDRVTMARSASALLGVTGVLALVATYLPHWSGVRELPVRITGSLALLAALVVLTAGRSMSPRGFRAIPFVATSLVSAGVYFAGGRITSSSFTMLYVWALLWTTYFLSRRDVAGVLLASLASQALVVANQPQNSAPLTVWLFNAATLVVVATLVSLLVGRLRSVANTDALTGLANRRAWDEAVGREVMRAGRLGYHMSVVVVDLDHFKRINDRGGHQAGDTALIEVAEAWARELRRTDLLARHGGDEFAVLLPGSGIRRATETMSRLRASTPHLSFSAGVAEWDRFESASDLLRRADAAVFAAKRGGRGRTYRAELLRAAHATG